MKRERPIITVELTEEEVAFLCRVLGSLLEGASSALGLSFKVESEVYEKIRATMGGDWYPPPPPRGGALDFVEENDRG